MTPRCRLNFCAKIANIIRLLSKSLTPRKDGDFLEVSLKQKIEAFVGQAPCGHFIAKVTVFLDENESNDLICQTHFKSKDEATVQCKKMADELSKGLWADMMKSVPSIPEENLNLH